MLTTAKSWQLLSTIALGVAIVAFLVAGLELTTAVWVSFLISGIAFGVEQILAAGERRRAG